MAQSNSRLVQAFHEKHCLSKPSVSRLLAHIFSSIFSNGMISLLIPGSAMIAFLRHYNVATGNSFSLLICTIIVLGFLRGCKAWQEDLNDYQKSLADTRHSYTARLRR